MRVQCINERKRKQLKAIRDEKLEKQRKVQKGMQALKRDSEVPERGRSPHQKDVLPEISQGDHTVMEGRPKTAEFSSSGTTGG